MDEGVLGLGPGLVPEVHEVVHGAQGELEARGQFVLRGVVQGAQGVGEGLGMVRGLGGVALPELVRLGGEGAAAGLGEHAQGFQGKGRGFVSFQMGRRGDTERGRGGNRLAACVTFRLGSGAAVVGVEDVGLEGGEVVVPHLPVVLVEPTVEVPGAAEVLPEAEGGGEAGEVAHFLTQGVLHVEGDLPGGEAAQVGLKLGLIDSDAGVEHGMGCDIP